MKKFEHNCPGCMFLGHENGSDFYFCSRGLPTVIARYGSGGSQYDSGLQGAKNILAAGYCDEPLARALILAARRGLCTEE